VNDFANHHPVEQSPLAVYSDLIRHALASGVPSCDYKLGADRANPFKCEADCQSNRASGKAASALSGANPISEVAEMVKGIDLAQTAPAEKSMPVGIDDRETKISTIQRT